VLAEPGILGVTGGAGVGVSAAAAALTPFVVVLTDPWNVGKALTWLSGSTYGRTYAQVAPVSMTLALTGPALWQAHRALDLLAVDDNTARRRRRSGRSGAPGAARCRVPADGDPRCARSG
jgi:ABC-type Fe3+-siderophore transport system permease subunit